MGSYSRVRLLRGLSGRVLDCGCLVGVYETYAGQVVATIDARGPVCTEPSHALHHEVALGPRPTADGLPAAGSVSAGRR
jgi:hypothetical protein